MVHVESSQWIERHFLSLAPSKIKKKGQVSFVSKLAWKDQNISQVFRKLIKISCGDLVSLEVLFPPWKNKTILLAEYFRWHGGLVAPELPETTSYYLLVHQQWVETSIIYIYIFPKKIWMKIFPNGILGFHQFFFQYFQWPFCSFAFLLFHIISMVFVAFFFSNQQKPNKKMDETPQLQLCHPCKQALHRKAYILLRTSPTSVPRCFRNRHQPGWLSDQRLGRKLRQLGFRKRFLMSNPVKSGLFYFKHLLLLPVSGIEMRQN